MANIPFDNGRGDRIGFASSRAVALGVERRSYPEITIILFYQAALLRYGLLE